MKINDRFDIRPDRYCWVLVEHVATDPNHRNTKKTTRESHTYHASVEQACTEILNRTGGECDTAQGLVQEWQKAVTAVREACAAMDTV